MSTPLDWLAVTCVFCGWVPIAAFMFWRFIRYIEWIEEEEDD